MIVLNFVVLSAVLGFVTGVVIELRLITPIVVTVVVVVVVVLKVIIAVVVLGFTIGDHVVNTESVTQYSTIPVPHMTKHSRGKTFMVFAVFHSNTNLFPQIMALSIGIISL